MRKTNPAIALTLAGTAAAFAAAHLALWFLADAWLLDRLDRPLTKIGCGVWVVRQFAVLLIWLRAAGTNRIVWRGEQEFQIHPDGHMEPLPTR